MKKMLIYKDGKIKDYEEERQHFVTSCEELRWEYCNCFEEYLYRQKVLVIPEKEYTPTEYVRIASLDVDMTDDIEIDRFDEIIAGQFNLWNYLLSESSELAIKGVKAVIVKFKSAKRLVQIPKNITNTIFSVEINKFQKIENEKNNVCKAVETKDSYNGYETEGQLNAYVAGINFVMQTLSERKKSSVWQVTFPDRKSIRIEGTDIFSIIFELVKMGCAYEEAVIFECLP